MEQQEIKKTNSYEIDIIGLFNKVIADKRKLAVVCFCSAVIGVIVALNTPKHYTADVILAPEVSGGSGMSSNLNDLASMVGIDLHSNGAAVDAIYPEIYPDLFMSSDFLVQLFDIKVRLLKDPTERTYFQHVRQDQKIPFWNYPMIWIGRLLETKEDTPAQAKKLNPFQLTKIETGVCNYLRGNVACSVDKKTSVITLSVTDQDQMVCAIVADTLQRRLQQYITEYRTKKARNDMQYVLGLYKDAKKQYEKARQTYADYADANQDVVLKSYQAKETDLENDMQLKFNIYTQLAQQYQMAQAKVQEKTPAFTIIQGASVPLKASSTPRLYIVVVFIILGFLAYGAWVILAIERKKKTTTRSEE